VDSGVVLRRPIETTRLTRRWPRLGYNAAKFARPPSPQSRAIMKLNFAVFVWILFMILLSVVGWKERKTVPLRWATGANPLTRLLVVGGLVAIVAVYVWWANRRDFK
jgi:hypothetical protein